MTSDTMAITAIARTLVVTRSNILEKKRTLHLTPLRNNQNSFFNGSHSSFFSTTFTAQFLQLGNFLMALRKVKVSFDLGDILRLLFTHLTISVPRFTHFHATTGLEFGLSEATLCYRNLAWPIYVRVYVVKRYVLIGTTCKVC